MQGTRTKAEAVRLATELLRRGHWVRIKDNPKAARGPGRLHNRYLVEWKER